jgi:hypothetical protein
VRTAATRLCARGNNFLNGALRCTWYFTVMWREVKETGYAAPFDPAHVRATVRADST